MDWSRQMREPKTLERWNVGTLKRSLWNVPVGLQLSVIYAVLLTVTLALLGWALYAQLDKYLIQNTVDRLDRVAQPSLAQLLFSRRIQDGQNRQRGPDFRPFGFEPSPQQIANLLVSSLSGPDIDVAVLDANGKTMAITRSAIDNVSRNVPALPAGWENLAYSEQKMQWIIKEPSGSRQLVLLTPLVILGPDASGQPIKTNLLLEQATSLTEADALLNQLRFYILFGIVAGTILGVIAGLLLTRIALRPLDRMANTAEAIAAGDLNRRVRMPEGRNEVARLGSAFDNMVGRLAASLETQRRFVADASHELRTPLTSLEGLSEMLLIGADRGDSGAIQRTVRSMHGELGRLGRLVTDLLTLSRLDGRATMTRSRVDVSNLASEVAAQMEPLAESKEVRLAVSSDGPTYVQGDPDKLKQVLINLMDNAVRYTPPGGVVQLSIGAIESRESEISGLHSALRTPGSVQIRVQDTGPGISEKDLPHIFDRFYRGDASRTRATGNSGLGLAIARAITEAHGGAITVRSEPGEGACFTVTLPMASGSTSQIPQATDDGRQTTDDLITQPKITA